MAQNSSSFFSILDIRPLVVASRIRLGGIRARGVPAVLVGAATIVFAASFGEALKRTASSLPETIRETRNLILLTRGARELPRSN